MARANFYFYLQPRYGAGSPGAVWDEALAKRVARDERESFDHALEGAYGPRDQQKAMDLGLVGIVEARYEHKKGWMARDLITGRTCYREERLASKLQAGDVVVGLKDEKGNAWEGRRKLARVVQTKSTPRVYVFFEGDDRNPVTLWHNDKATVEREVEAHEFKHEV
jgi:hypothetical protein